MFCLNEVSPSVNSLRDNGGGLYDMGRYRGHSAHIRGTPRNWIEAESDRLIAPFQRTLYRPGINA